MSDEGNPDVMSLTVQLLSAYLSNNTVASSELPELIATTRAALTGRAEPEVAEESHQPAVSIRKSLASGDYLISLIDGKRYKLLTRHLAKHGLKPADYRARYNLPSDYPMVARNYADQRRELAKSFGLGRKPQAAEPDAVPAALVEGASDAAHAGTPAAAKGRGAGKAAGKTAVKSANRAASKAGRPAPTSRETASADVKADPATKRSAKSKAAADTATPATKADGPRPKATTGRATKVTSDEAPVVKSPKPRRSGGKAGSSPVSPEADLPD